jgi:hypothetical protein
VVTDGDVQQLSKFSDSIKPFNNGIFDLGNSTDCCTVCGLSGINVNYAAKGMGDLCKCFIVPIDISRPWFVPFNPPRGRTATVMNCTGATTTEQTLSGTNIQSISRISASDEQGYF